MSDELNLEEIEERHGGLADSIVNTVRFLFDDNAALIAEVRRLRERIATMEIDAEARADEYEGVKTALLDAKGRVTLLEGVAEAAKSGLESGRHTCWAVEHCDDSQTCKGVLYTLCPHEYKAVKAALRAAGYEVGA